MSEAAVLSQPAANAATTPKLITELKVTAHLMNLETGVFCIVQTPGARHEPDAAGLPGVRVTLPPAAPAGVSIASFRPDGWLSGQTDAAVVRVNEGPAQILVTIYQNIASTDPAPRLQVIRLSEDPATAAAARAAVTELAPRSKPEIVAHVQVKGDVGAMLGDWIGDRASKRWIEGFMIVPQGEVAAAALEYQAVLGRGWLSPWSEGGQLCGSRGMSLPILGLRVRLKGQAVNTHEVHYEATFVDGSTVPLVAAGEPCEAASLSPMEAFRVVISPRSGAGAGAGAGSGATGPGRRGPAAALPKPQPRPVARPAPVPVKPGKKPR